MPRQIRARWWAEVLSTVFPSGSKFPNDRKGAAQQIKEGDEIECGCKVVVALHLGQGVGSFRTMSGSFRAISYSRADPCAQAIDQESL